jgi:hypothetical protein
MHGTTQEKPKAAPMLEKRPTEVEVPEYIKDQIINDLWDRTTDMGLIHDPILARAD